MRKILFFISFLLFIPTINATHIVGGELNYSYLGNDDYEIRLTVYRDCFNGVPPFDDPASLGVFNANNILLQNILMNFTHSDTIINVFCSTSICYERTTYIDTLNLPPISGGYQLSYQRCCRNGITLNIINPLATGTTFYATIPEINIATINSNPVFNNFPLPEICANQPYTFDHSATDQDGDSLFYELSTPLEGASQAMPAPQPPNNPPYSNITWATPYSTVDMMGGTSPLSINQNSGLLTVTPFSLGRFTVGIKVSEYRNGIKLGETRRDLDYIVTSCSSINTLITITGDTLSSNQFGAIYQWLDCDNNFSPIAGETNQSFTPVTSGNYAVQIITCTEIDTSLCVSLITDINEINTKSFSFGPNPVHNQLILNAENLEIKEILIISLTGKIVKTPVLHNNTISVKNLTKGIYFLRIRTKEGVIDKKFIKE